MIPAFVITVTNANTGNAADLSAALKDRLIEGRISDEAGIKSDELELTLDDRGPNISAPRPGDMFTVQLGYDQTRLHPMGRFVLDEVIMEGPPNTLIIRARAADLRQSLKVRKERSWDNITIASLVAQMADEYGLEPLVAPQYAGTTLFHYDQNESDLHFLTRLGKIQGAMASVKDGKLIFAQKGAGKKASGAAFDVITLAAEDLIHWRAFATARPASGSVKARWYDDRAAAMQFEQAGTDAPITLLPDLYPDSQSAKSAADAALRRGAQDSATLALTLPGNARIMAERPLAIQGLRDGVGGHWIVKSAIHTFGQNGFTTRLEAEVPPA